MGFGLAFSASSAHRDDCGFGLASPAAPNVEASRSPLGPEIAEGRKPALLSLGSQHKHRAFIPAVLRGSSHPVNEESLRITVVRGPETLTPSGAHEGV